MEVRLEFDPPARCSHTDSAQSTRVASVDFNDEGLSQDVLDCYFLVMAEVPLVQMYTSINFYQSFLAVV